jgi:NAD+ kinase
MRIDRALLVYRKSLYQIYVQEHGERAVKDALRRGDRVALGLRASHEVNQRARIMVERTLARLGIETVARWRGQARAARRYDLVLSLGGDGTLLDTSHRVPAQTPLLGINSDPGRSVGALCGCGVEDLADCLKRLLADKLAPRPVTRIRARIDGREVLGPTLNDLLFAHSCPAGLTRFDLALVPAEEALEHHSGRSGKLFRQVRSSGLWVATATGSTAAIRSAGGRPMRPGSRTLQLLVREPYVPPTEERDRRLERGSVPPGTAMVIVSRLRTAMVWADGAHHRASVGYSQQLVIDAHPEPLLLVRR